MKIHHISLAAILLISLGSCNAIKNTWSNLNIFPPSQDLELGKQVDKEIKADPYNFPILERSKNKAIYQYVEGLRDKVLSSNEIVYRDSFIWDVTIIDQDTIQNAFVTPGGYIYVYTGLMKNLEAEDELIGVIGHEIAHADQRHSTQQLTKVLGVAILADAVLGKSDALQQVVTALFQLRFSRTHETEADTYSVKYLCPTSYNAAAMAKFFEKMEGQPTPPEFLSTHPSPSNRVENIHEQYEKQGCTGTQSNVDKYTKFKKLLDNKISPPPAPKPKANGDGGAVNSNSVKTPK